MQVGDKYIIEIEKVNEDNTYKIKGIDGALEESELIQLEKVKYTADEAWEVAAYIHLSPKDGGMDSEEFRKIFGNLESKTNLFQQCAVDDVLDKVRSYEKRRADIGIGAVCQYDKGRYGVVVCIEGDNSILYTSDNQNISRKLIELEPTGKTIPLQDQLRSALLG